MMNNKFDGVVGLLGITVGLIGIGYALGTHSKMAKISENLDRSIDELASNMPVNIPDGMVERAVEKAVSNEVKHAVSNATDRVIVDIKRDIHRQVSDAVDSEYSNIKKTVLEELTSEAAKIDTRRVRADIEKAAKELALEKFEENLDDITEEYKGYLSSVSKIGKTFADAIVQPSTREPVFKIVAN